MRAGLSQFDGLLVEFAGTAVGAGDDPLSHGLYAVLAVWVKEDDNGVPLGVVQRVHSLGRYIQQGVLVLCGARSRDTRSCSNTLSH